MLCPECGARNLPEASECVACGEPLSVDESEAVDPLIGRKISGRYTLTAILGEGSMGVVYAADQEGLDHEVAVKVLHAHVAADPKVKRRFHREARMTSRLSHPNTVRVFDFGRTDDGMLYLAMELLDGPDLLELLQEEEPLTPRRIVTILEQVLLALEEAHDEGIIHRDLKPENVMVIEDHQGRERVKVCDFGIAKLVEAEGSAITVTGFVCGTPEYMAPEQARGEELDPRADIYALGCLLYRMLTGVVPFRGKSALATITEHLTRDLVRPRERAPERHIPRALEQVCQVALAKDPADRYPNAAAMRQALKDALASVGPNADDPLGTHPTRDSEPPDEPPSSLPNGPRARRLAIGGVALAALTLIAAVVVGRTAGRGNPPSMGTWPVESEAEPEAGSESESEAEAESEADSDSDSEAEAEAESESESESEAESESESEAEAMVRAPTKTSPAGSVPPSASPTVGSPGVAAPDSYRAHYDEGRRLFLANDLAGAIGEFERAASLAPDRAPVYKELGRARMRAGQVSAARAAYRRYLSLAPNAPDRAIVERLLDDESR